MSASPPPGQTPVSPMNVDEEGGPPPAPEQGESIVEDSENGQHEVPLEEIDIDMDILQTDSEALPEPDLDQAATDVPGPQMMSVNGIEVPVFGDPMDGLPGIGRLGARRDKSLKEFLGMMDEFAPIIPDAVTDYYLMKAGFESSDVRIKRLLALATQKFVSDIATDAYQYSRIRSAWAGGSSGSAMAAAPGQFRSTMPSRFGGGGGAGGVGGAGSAGGSSGGSGKVVLTMEDLASALAEYGVNVHRPEFYR